MAHGSVNENIRQEQTPIPSPPYAGERVRVRGGAERVQDEVARLNGKTPDPFHPFALVL
jgi:hypothetical protein